MRDRRNQGWPRLFGRLFFLIAPILGLAADAQIKLHDFRFAVPFEQTNTAFVINRAKTLLVAGQAQVLSNNFYGAQVVRIENYQQDAKTNLIIRAPECVFDAANSIAYSTNRLELESPSGLFIEGFGFTSYLTNFNLVISNAVRTRVQQRLLQEAPDVTGARPQTNQASGTNIAMTVTADRFELNYPLNIITYVGHVHVEHAQLTLESARLTVHRNTNGTIEQVIAEQEVRILNNADHSQAVGDLAIYTLVPLETIELSGHARWNDDRRKSQADLFVFHPRQKHLRAQGHAWMSLPRQNIIQPQFGQAKATNVQVEVPVEITAEMLDLQMPSTNQPARSLLADRNVVIVSPADQSRATANKASFQERTGVVELTGDAMWQAGDRLARGDLLRYDRTNGVFLAQRNAYLKLPVSAFGSALAKPVATTQPKSTNAPPPQFLEIHSSQYTYTSNSLVFRDDVHGELLQGTEPRGHLQCSLLEVRFTNQLETVFAKGGVKLAQFPMVTATGRKLARTMRCEQLQIRMQPTGAAERIIADSNIFAEQQEWRATNAQPVHSLFTADHAIADFFPRTNRVQEATANGHVSILQESRVANGERALYHGATDTMELVGHPTAEFPEGKITDADILVWDRTQNKITGRKLKAQGEVHPGRTNAPPSPQSK